MVTWRRLRSKSKDKVQQSRNCEQKPACITTARETHEIVDGFEKKKNYDMDLVVSSVVGKLYFLDAQ